MNRTIAKILQYSGPLLLSGIFLSIIGIRIFLSMPRGIFPEVNFPRVVVELNLGYAPLEVMEWGVTSLLEKELRTVPGVRIVKSSTSRGTSTIHVFLNENEDVDLALNRVNTKVGEIRTLLPPNIQIRVKPITASAFTGAEYCFTSSELSPRELRYFTEYVMKPRILIVPGVYNILVLGGDLAEFKVSLDPRKMSFYNITLADVDDRIRNSNVLDFTGPVRSKDLEILSFAGRFVRNDEDIGSIIIASNFQYPVRLNDIASIQLGSAWKFKDLSLNGKECVALDVFYQQGINQAETSANVKNSIEEVLHSVDSKIEYRSWDLNDFTDRATFAVLIDLLLGMLIIGCINYFFLKDIRSSLIGIVSMPFAASLTFLGMKILGMTLNLMTLGGLTAAIGLVVDNTVIILEMFHKIRTENANLNSSEILERVLSKTVKPIFWGTAAIAIVFTPIGMLSGLAGMFFEPMATVHGMSLAISVLLAIVFLPGLILIFSRNNQLAKHDQYPRSIRKQSSYEKLLSKFLKHPIRNSFLLILIPAIAMISLNFAKSGFLPIWDEGDLVIDYRSERPLSLKSTVESIYPLEEYLKTVPEVDFYIRKTGTSLGSFNKAPYMGEIIVKLKDKRSKSVFNLVKEIEEATNKLNLDIEFDYFQILPDRLNDLSGSGKPIVLYLRGENRKNLEKATEQYKSLLENIPGLDSVRIDEPPRVEELLFKIEEKHSRVLDLNPYTVIQNVKLGIFNVETMNVQSGLQSIPIRIQLSRKDLTDTTSLSDIPFYSLRGGLTKLSSLGKIELKKNRVESNHIDGTPVSIITAQLSSSDLGGVISEIQHKIRENPIEGVFTELAGDYATQQKSFRELIMAFITGIGLIFIISFFYLNHLRTALFLTAAALLPPSFGVTGLILLGIPLDVSAFSGLISVTGVAVANIYMAIHSIQECISNNVGFEKALMEGMLLRLRPILMTNLAAMAGFIPIALGVVEGDEILRPFSIAIIIGLFGSLFTTLFAMPVLLFAYCRKFYLEL